MEFLHFSLFFCPIISLLCLLQSVLWLGGSLSNQSLYPFIKDNSLALWLGACASSITSSELLSAEAAKEYEEACAPKWWGPVVTENKRHVNTSEPFIDDQRGGVAWGGGDHRCEEVASQGTFYSLFGATFSHFSITSCRQSERKKAFTRIYPEYDDKITVLAQKEMARFAGQAYMDYAGSGVYQGSQIKDIYEDQLTHAYGNAHSRNPSADLTDQRITEARKQVMEFFEAPPQSYSIIFTSGATGALKLTGEDFPWSKDSIFYYLRINHNSVLGIREYALRAGSTFGALSEDEVNQILEEREKAAKERKDEGDENRATAFCLFAFPAKDNFSGMYYPLEWIDKIHKYGLHDNCQWRVLLDAAAFVPTSRLSLAKYPADYTAVSFYKMFGAPTGLGVLLLRTSDAPIFNNIYFGGGAVAAASCDSRWCRRKNDPSSRFEDGTVSFLAIASVRFGLQRLKDIGMEKINKHVAILTKYMAEELDKLRHLNQQPVIVRYSRDNELPTGGILTFNVYGPDGSLVDFSQVEMRASDSMIHLRAGCFCNPGGCQDYLGLTDTEIRETSMLRESCSDPTNGLYNKPLGAVRISLGYLSTFEDADLVLEFFRRNFVL